jgi:excisionase family DNA binding protein
MAIKQQQQQEFLSIDDAAIKLGIDITTLRRMIAARKLPAYRVGNKLIRIRIDDLDAFIRPVVPNDVA